MVAALYEPGVGCQVSGLITRLLLQHPARMSTVLIGYRGSGKSSIGHKLADRLWQKCVDTDDLVVAKAGKSIAQIFADHGEPYFRDLETQVVKEVAAIQDHVIALGGGAPMRQENRDAIKSAGHRVIYLKCEPEELFKRISADPDSAANRPALTQFFGSVEEISKVLAEREPIYRQMADAELEVTYLTPDEAMVYIVRLL
jgi:shikimate kinase